MHDTVLQQPAVDALITNVNGYYIDGTFGRGGHSKEILTRLSQQGHLLAIDKDPQAVAAGQILHEQDSRFDIIQGSFAQLSAVLASQQWPLVDGILLDLGVSSPQLDEAQRGFSFLRDGPLDMRMDPQHGISAAQWLAKATQLAIAKVLKEYGEERYAKRIAQAIVRARSDAPINTTGRLAEIVAKAHPAWVRGKHPATQTFQAIRLWVNQELEDLSDLLEQVLGLLKVGGRFVVISFHSLEDRLVKRFIKRHVYGDTLPKNLPVMDTQIRRRLKKIGSAERVSEQEVGRNRRARSAIMRVAEKISE